MTREEALSKVKGYLTDLLPSEEYDEVEEITKALEPKVGHWMWDCSIIPSTPVSPEEIDYCGWVCSECKQFPDDNDWDDPDEPPHYRYCPNCGCPMESLEHNEAMNFNYKGKRYRLAVTEIKTESEE